MKFSVPFLLISCFILGLNLTLIEVVFYLLKGMNLLTHTFEVAVKAWHLGLKAIFVDRIIVLTCLHILLPLSVHHFLVMLVYVIVIPLRFISFVIEVL